MFKKKKRKEKSRSGEDSTAYQHVKIKTDGQCRPCYDNTSQVKAVGVASEGREWAPKPDRLLGPNSQGTGQAVVLSVRSF